jgi:hypothetical protein
LADIQTTLAKDVGELALKPQFMADRLVVEDSRQSCGDIGAFLLLLIEDAERLAKGGGAS